MRKIIRPTYPIEISLGLLILIYVLSFLLSSQLFTIPWHDLSEGNDVYFAMFLVSTAVIIMILILWEEFLFPIKIKHIEDGVVFRNHRNKLIKQLLIYFTIPAIFAFIYFQYEVHLFRFVIWAAICMISPVAGKLISGINNYNDFLTLTKDAIEYKDNEKEGNIKLSTIKQIVMIKDQRDVSHKIKLIMKDNSELIIDIDKMELEAFFVSIDNYITENYTSLVAKS